MSTTYQPTVEEKPRKRKPVALIVLAVWTVLCVIWAITGVNAADCGSSTGDGVLSAEDARAACEAGAGIGMGLILFVWAFVVFIIAAVTVIVRLGRR